MIYYFEELTALTPDDKQAIGRFLSIHFPDQTFDKRWSRNIAYILLAAFQDHQAYFNLSYSECGSAIALASGPVGVDIQTNILDSDIAMMILSESDKRHPPANLTLLFSIKEAYLKYLGTGLAISMKALSLSDVSNHLPCYEKGLYYDGKIIQKGVLTYCHDHPLNIKRIHLEALRNILYS